MSREKNSRSAKAGSTASLLAKRRPPVNARILPHPNPLPAREGRGGGESQAAPGAPVVFLNGRLVPQAAATVSVFDRGFLYGDGLFETIRVYGGRPFRWGQHCERLRRGAEFLKIHLPYSPGELGWFAQRLIERNQLPESLLRITLSRGVGPRGYSPIGADSPTLVMMMHPAPPVDPQNPPRWRLVTSSFRVPAKERLAAFKSCNKLAQILARAEAGAVGADEALLLNTDGEIAEAASSNLFWLEGGTVCTTPLSAGILAGVTRALVLELCATLSLPCREKRLKPAALKKVSGVFVTLSTLEVVEITRLDGFPLRRSKHVGLIRRAYREAVRRGMSGD